MRKVFYRSLLLGLAAILLSGCWGRSPTKTHTAAAILPDVQTPLPLFLRDVYPKPGNLEPQTNYMTGGIGGENQFYYRESGAICVDLNQKNLLEQNDHDLNSYDYIGRSHLKVNTLGPNSCSISIHNDRVWSTEAGGALFDERGNSIGGILLVCWKVNLAPGIYEATYEYSQTSGHVLSYTWSFEITE